MLLFRCLFSSKPDMTIEWFTKVLELYSCTYNYMLQQTIRVLGDKSSCIIFRVFFVIRYPSIGIEQRFIPFWSIRQTQLLSGGSMNIIASSFKLFHATLLMISKREFLRKISCLIRSLIHLESNKCMLI